MIDQRVCRIGGFRRVRRDVQFGAALDARRRICSPASWSVSVVAVICLEYRMGGTANAAGRRSRTSPPTMKSDFLTKPVTPNRNTLSLSYKNGLPIGRFLQRSRRGRLSRLSSKCWSAATGPRIWPGAGKTFRWSARTGWAIWSRRASSAGTCRNRQAPIGHTNGGRLRSVTKLLTVRRRACNRSRDRLT